MQFIFEKKQNYGQKSMNYSRKDIGLILICAATIVMGMWYYYEIQLAYRPNAEDVMTIEGAYKVLNFGVEYHIRDIISESIAFLSTTIGGMSNFSVRLHFTMMQGIILVCTMYLALWSGREKKLNAFLIPIFLWFSVFLHPVTPDDPYGINWDYGSDFWYQWPYIYHVSARIYALLCISLINMCMNAKSDLKKKVLVCICGGITIYAAILKDLIFYALFILPAGIVLVLHLVHSEKYRKYIIYIAGVCMSGVLATKVLPLNCKDVLWGTSPVSTYGTIYGATNWGSIDRLGTGIINYIVKILDYFYVLIPGKPVISLYSLVFGAKLIVLAGGYIIVFNILKSSIKTDDSRYDIVDEILAWSYLVLSGALLLTEYGYWNEYTQRYGVGLVAVMTILLCRHIDEFFAESLKFKAKVSQKEKICISVCVIIFCLCTMKPVWEYSAHTCHDEDMQAVLGYIESNDIGHTVASFYLAPPMTAMSNGEVFICHSVEEVKQLFGEDAKITYMITRYDHESGKYHDYLYYENFENYQELCDKYSEPDRVIDYDSFSLCIWEDGIKIME